MFWSDTYCIVCPSQDSLVEPSHAREERRSYGKYEENEDETEEADWREAASDDDEGDLGEASGDSGEYSGPEDEEEGTLRDEDEDHYEDVEYEGEGYARL